MSYEQFRELVKAMRQWQREYFRTRSKTALSDSKRLEKLVDEALSEQLTFDGMKGGEA